MNSFVASARALHKGSHTDSHSHTHTVAAMAKAAGKKGGSKKIGRKSFNTYINRVNKNAKKGLTLSSKSVKILNSFVQDMFDKIATQAAAVARASKKSTIGASEIQTAVRLTLPADLAKHSISEASKAVTNAFK